MEALRVTRLVVVALGISALISGRSDAQGVPRAATLLPNTTKSYVSVPDYPQAEANFDQTQIGQLLADPAMKPFADDLRQQIKDKLLAGGVQLGITLEDVQGIRSGEVCFASVQPDGPQSDAVVLLVDVTGNEAAAQQLLAKIEQNQVQNGARKSNVQIAGAAMSQFTFPQQPGEAQSEVAFYGIVQNLLIASDSQATAGYVLAALQRPTEDNLATLEAYQTVIQRAAEGRSGETFDVEWFIEPFGLAEVVRSRQGGRKRRGTDMLQLLRNQGFDAIRGIGGQMNFIVDDMEMLHSTFIYAPTDPQAEEGQRFRLGARVLLFPNVDQFQPYDWVPAQLATFLNFRWNVQDAFFFSETIVNEYADDEIFDELIESLKTDPVGPQVDIVESIVQHLDNQVCMLVDVEQPITPQSEQRMLAIHLLNPEPVKAAVRQIMKDDPNAERHVVGEEEIWEIHEEEEEIPTLTIVGPGSPQFITVAHQILPEEENNAPALQNAAVSVVGEWLYFANNKDIIQKVIETKLDPQAARLATAEDFQRVQAALQRLGAGSDSFRHFSRSDEASRVTYELMQQGKMPESESALGRIINRLWSLGEEEIGVRDAEIDASKLPPFAQVEKYFGPSGAYGRTEDNGWYISGAMLKK